MCRFRNGPAPCVQPGNYDGYVYDSQQLSVTKRAVSLKSESASKVFDGIALTRPEVAGWKQLGDEGFVDGQVSDVRATAALPTFPTARWRTRSSIPRARASTRATTPSPRTRRAERHGQANRRGRYDRPGPADVVYSGKAQQQKPS